MVSDRVVAPSAAERVSAAGSLTGSVSTAGSKSPLVKECL